MCAAYFGRRFMPNAGNVEICMTSQDVLVHIRPCLLYTSDAADD